MSFLSVRESPRVLAAEKSPSSCWCGGINLVDCQAAAVMCRRWWRNYGWHQLVYIEVGSTGSTWWWYGGSCSTTVLYTDVNALMYVLYSQCPGEFGLQNIYDWSLIDWMTLVLILNMKGDVRQQSNLEIGRLGWQLPGRQTFIKLFIVSILINISI